MNFSFIKYKNQHCIAGVDTYLTLHNYPTHRTTVKVPPLPPHPVGVRLAREARCIMLTYSQSLHTLSGFGESEYFCIVYLTSSKLQDRPAVPGLSNIISRLYHQTFDHLIDQFINRSFPFKKDFVETPKSTCIGNISGVGNSHYVVLSKLVLMLVS